MSGDRTTLMNSGSVNMIGSVIGNHSTASVSMPEAASAPKPSCEVGILTVIPVETAAVREVLDLTLHPDHPSVLVGDRHARVVAMQIGDQGQEAAAVAAAKLATDFQPRFIVLVGIGGGIHKRSRIADVVVATRVVAYDLRKETPQGTQRRTQEFTAPAPACTAVDTLFIERGNPLAMLDFVAWHSPVGSGNAVIADRKSRIIKDLRRYNDKIMAVDMESAGLARYCLDNPPVGWVVVRGISDNADRHKNDDRQAEAARNAAIAARELLPCLTRQL